ncbi:hypothetical protein [Novosphingobium terrae]|nr:hypothetical protein [Novosphingobium terrae]
MLFSPALLACIADGAGASASDPLRGAMSAYGGQARVMDVLTRHDEEVE